MSNLNCLERFLNVRLLFQFDKIKLVMKADTSVQNDLLGKELARINFIE